MHHSLIINSPFEPPTHHWRRKSDRQLELVSGRRPAGYEIFDTRNNTTRVVTLDLVNRIRERVAEWRTAGWPGLTSITRQLLEHWQDRSPIRQYPFYFCQLEAIETLIWHVEAPAEFRQGIFVPGDGGPWERICSKMATGTGKTALMAMIITWQVLNALAYPKETAKFASRVLIIAPGLTVRERLQILRPGHPQNYYDEFSLCPNEALRQKLNGIELLIENWHTLMPARPPERSVVRKGAENDEAYVRRVLGPLAASRNLIVLNDEAHHAYRRPAELKISRKDVESLGIDLEEATCWIAGLDRIHRQRRIVRCFDLSATPFAPTGKTSTEAALFDWVVSDFGLNDAIEAGLVKTPRVVIRDDALPDARTYRSRLYHLYRETEVGEDINRRGAQATEALPQLVRIAYTLLGADWRATRQSWQAAGHDIPPVMLTVCNRTETAARIEHYFGSGDVQWPELQAPERTLRVDSKVLAKAEAGEAAGSDKAYEERLQAIVAATDIPATRKAELRALKKEELLRAIVDNVGKRGTGGQDLQNVISVAMLSEGWDAKNVTHILGLRAFTSQLLCEQVVGRGLRRVAYETETVRCPDGVERELFRPEYVNVFGVPLTVFQDSEEGGAPPPPPRPSTAVQSLAERSDFEIVWPNVLRIDAVVRPELTIDWAQVPALKIDPARIQLSAELAPALGDAADLSRAVSIDLEKLPADFRLQRLLFVAARKAFEQLRPGYEGSREWLVQQLIRLVERFFASDRLEIPSRFHQDPLRRRILIALSIDEIVQHVIGQIEQRNVERLEPVFDPQWPIGSTRQMRTWYTTRPCLETAKSQISHAVADSTWEQYTVGRLEACAGVAAFARNDHLGFQVHYLWHGSRRRYVPDFLIRFANGKQMVLEIKGEDSEQDRCKRRALDAWVQAVNSRGGFGVWCRDVVCGKPARIDDVLDHHAGTGGASMPVGEAQFSLGTG